MAGFRGLPSAPAYSTSKVALRAYGDALRPLLKPHGIAVSTVFPGFIKTPLTDVNPFPMPFLMDSERFADQAFKAIARGDAWRVIPWQMGVVAAVLGWLPRWFYDAVMGAQQYRKKRRRN